MTKTYVEIVVEYVRTDKLVFCFDSEDQTMGATNAPEGTGPFLRVLQYWLHRGKDLGRSEHPRLVTWNFLDHDIFKCERYLAMRDNYNVAIRDNHDPVIPPDMPCTCAERFAQRVEETKERIHNA